MTVSANVLLSHASQPNALNTSGERLLLRADLDEGLHGGSGNYDSAYHKLGPPSSDPHNVPSFPASYSRLDAWWILEIASLVASIVALAVVVLILKIHDGKTLASWTFYFSLNTVVAFLGGTVAKSVMIFSVSACLGQGKFSWFSKRRGQLALFKTMDEASRGPYGSIQLLFCFRGRYLLSVGAIATILGLAVEPALQAIINTRGQLDPILSGAQASITKCQKYDSGLEEIQLRSKVEIKAGKSVNEYPVTLVAPDFRMRAGVYKGFQASSNEQQPDLAYTCSTGNCTWPTFVSLAVCSSCFDITSSIVRRSFNSDDFADISDAWTEPNFWGYSKRKGSGTQYELPDSGLHINNFDDSYSNGTLAELMTATTDATPDSSVNMKNSQTLLTTFTVLRADEDFIQGRKSWEGARAPVATECGLTLCLKAFHSSVVQGNLSEVVVAETSEKVPGSWMANSTRLRGFRIDRPKDLGNLSWNPLNQPHYVSRYDFQLSTSGLPETSYPADAAFNVSQKAADSMVAYLTSLLPLQNDSWPHRLLGGQGSWDALGRNELNPPSVYQGNSTVSFSQDILQPLYESQNLTETFDTLARSLTNVFRSTQADIHPGNAEQWVIHYHIRWAFLVVPAAFVISGAIFTLLTILNARQTNLGTWKTSAIATMAYGIDAAGRQYLRGSHLRNETLSHASQGFKVAMQDRPEGPELTAAVSLETVRTKAAASQSSPLGMSAGVSRVRRRRSLGGGEELDDRAREDEIPLEPYRTRDEI